MSPTDETPSKTRRKAEMHARQALGVDLVELAPTRFDALAGEFALSEELCDAIRLARTIRAREGRRRQLQYIGRLMRSVDAQPIAARLAAWAQGHATEVARQHGAERWRDALIDDPGALDALCSASPTLDRPRFRALIARAREEARKDLPRRAARELYRELTAIESPPPPPMPKRIHHD